MGGDVRPCGLELHAAKLALGQDVSFLGDQAHLDTDFLDGGVRVVALAGGGSGLRLVGEDPVIGRAARRHADGRDLEDQKSEGRQGGDQEQGTANRLQITHGKFLSSCSSYRGRPCP